MKKVQFPRKMVFRKADGCSLVLEVINVSLSTACKNCQREFLLLNNLSLRDMWDAVLSCLKHTDYEQVKRKVPA